MKKFLKILGIVVLSFIILGIGACMLISEKMPEGIEGPEAEQLTNQMFEAVNKEAWDSTKIVQWTYVGGHNYLWNKETTDLQVQWGEKEVIMNLADYEGRALKDGKELEGEDKRKMIDKAYAFFCNDMFWLNAPVKARDEGTTRKLVEMEDGQKGLLVTYSSGGVTPGDSYLWILDEAGKPTGWKMWTQILPVKGVYTTWENWTKLESGAEISQLHGSPIFDAKVTNLKSGRSYDELGIKSPFK